MKKSEIKAYRYSHLQILLTQTFQGIAHDNISHQMDKHEISSQYSEDRIVEVFLNLINKEREELILQTELQIETLKKENNEYKKKIKEKMNSSENSDKSIRNNNIDMRTKLGEVNAILLGRKWKRNQLKKSENIRIQQLDKRINYYSPTVKKISENLHDYKIELNQLYSDINSLMMMYPKYFGKAQKQIQKKYSQMLAYSETDIPVLKEKLRNAREVYNDNFEAMRDLFRYVTDSEPESFSIVDISEFKTHIQDFKRMKGNNANYNYAQKIYTKIIKQFERQDEKYQPILSKQRIALDRLKMELNNELKRLKLLINSDSTIDRNFLSQILASKKQMASTQKRTDDLMSMLKKIDFTTSSSTV